MISKEDLKQAIKLNAKIINENRPDWDDRLFSSLKSTWGDSDARQLYWNILVLMSIKTGGGIKYTFKHSFDTINLTIGSKQVYITQGDFNTSTDEIRDRLLRKGVFPEIIDRLKIEIIK